MQKMRMVMTIDSSEYIERYKTKLLELCPDIDKKYAMECAEISYMESDQDDIPEEKAKLELYRFV